MKKERREALMRIVVGIVSGIIMSLWRGLANFVGLIHFLVVLVTGKRSESLANFTNKFIQYEYDFYRYMFFVTNQRVFPFEELREPIEKFK